MKIDITIRDASPEQAVIVLEAINGGKVSAPKVTAETNNPTITKITDEQRDAFKASSENGTPAGQQSSGMPNFNGQPAAEQPNPNVQQPVTPETHPANGGQHEAPQTTDVSRDIHGLPWDERIHSGKASDAKHTRNADGAWKKRKGVKPELVAQVEAELRGQAAAPQPNFNGGQQPQQPQNNGMPNFNGQPAADQVGQQQQPQNNGFPGNNGQQQQQTYTPGGEVTFASMMQRINDATASGKIDGMYLVGLCSRISHTHGCQIAAVTDLMNRPPLIQAAMDLMTQDNRGI